MTEVTGRITAILGPTNTGKTHYALERMLGHRTGVIGLPLRLLAREVYDRIVALRGPSAVALVTGEERIAPDNAAYWVATVEAMPDGISPDFLAVDEIQLCADPERGHVFTDRLLRARGRHETLFLGAETMRGAIAELVPEARFQKRERFSTLACTGACKISRMPPRSAIISFSIDSVYAMAELLRRQKGGAAVVMGALSPRTRNAQVEMYQNGEVDYLVATDAIGMGLNLDINHVAFSSLSKFDGRRIRALAPNELAQIAGRAGRHMNDGTFGVTGEAEKLDEHVAQAITEHRFAPIRKLQWRNPDLSTGSIDALIASLEVGPEDPRLARSGEADDLLALKSLAGLPHIREKAVDGKSVELLWDVCRVPDFRDISQAEHASLLESIFGYLHEFGHVPGDWMNSQVKRIDRTDGGIDTLSKRLAYVRTWTYVAQRQGWVDDESHWRGATRAVEDRLSDALHEALMQRFVDRRTSVLLRRLKQKEAMLAEVNSKGEVSVENQFVGRLNGFRFSQDASAGPDEAKTLRQAALQALKPEFSLRADRFYNASDAEIDFTEQGGLMWGEHAVGKLVAGSDPLKPLAEAFVDEEAGPDAMQKVQRRLQHFIDRRVATLYEPLLVMQKDDELTGLVRGFAFRLVEALGILPREDVASEVKELDQDARKQLRKHGVRFGQFTIFMPALLKPAPTRLRLVLWSLAEGLLEFPASPPPGLVTIPSLKQAPEACHAMSGYRKAGERAIRIDILERLADFLRIEDSRKGFEATSDMLSITGTTLEQFAGLMQGLGYAADRGEREKGCAGPSNADAGTSKNANNEDGGIAGKNEECGSLATAESGIDGPAEASAASRCAAAPNSESGDAEGEVPSVASNGTKESADGAAQTGIKAAVDSGTDAGAGETAAADSAPEVFYTFTWKGIPGKGERPSAFDERAAPSPGFSRKAEQRPIRDKQSRKPPRKGAHRKGAKPEATRANAKAKTFEARPPVKNKGIDPDNPFAAALMGFKGKE